VKVGPVPVPVLEALRVPMPAPRPPVNPGPNVAAKLPLALIAVLPPTVEASKGATVVGPMVFVPDPAPPDTVFPAARPVGLMLKALLKPVPLVLPVPLTLPPPPLILAPLLVLAIKDEPPKIEPTDCSFRDPRRETRVVVAVGAVYGCDMMIKIFEEEESVSRMLM
jgi:hypothetical protein